MKHIDQLLVSIINHNKGELDTLVAARDANVMKSLANSIVGQYFITENQSKLLLKILHDNHQHFPAYTAELVESLAMPTWSRHFRQIEQVKRMYIGSVEGEDLSLIVEFTFSAHIRKVLTQANRNIENLVQSTNGKVYFAELTERNIVTLVELLRPLGFEFDDLVTSHYDIIKSWDEAAIKEQFQLTSMQGQNFLKNITADLGISTEIDKNIIKDRSMRYRYYDNEVLESDGTLARELATRIRSKVWVDKNKRSLDEVVDALVALKRLPIMVVFDNYTEDKSFDVLEQLSTSLERHNIDKEVGIYFRLPNNPNGAKFNSLIAEKKFNHYLGADTKVVGVQAGKIPKFFLTGNWKPMSIIAIDHQMRSSKTAVYAGCCDLIVTYTDTPPIVENTEKWQ